MDQARSGGRQALLRALPAVNDVLALESLAQAKSEAGHALAVQAVRGTLDRVRHALIAGERDTPPTPEELASLVRQALAAGGRPACRHVINATGVIIHTGLGRAVLPEAALRAIAEEARGYCLLETERETGRRGERGLAVTRLLRELTGAEAALVVNNNAAATLLCLNGMARGREVIVSRGQLVEIGGSFRIPEILAQSG
ncbi:MAG: L-seryl-tRNA(Sec) selenium transferase, partial [Armatimonadetes bacterium]|nr:L-seryl-tRNA(Sec) selenium transferase [Armatimonadota bacterium]